VSGKCKFRMSLTLSIVPSRILALTVTILTPPNGASIFAVALYPGHLSYYAALKKAGVPVEMHLYAQGGHAFGLRRTNSPATAWPQLVETWLRTIGMVSE
jgi:acetyl esterase/lipase